MEHQKIGTRGSLYAITSLFVNLKYAMASLLDSEAQFLQRANEFRISEPTVRRLKTSGLTTFGVLAYAHGQPGQQINDEAFETWVGAKIDPNAPMADISSLKRLLFESQTLMLASLKDQISSQDSLAVKRVPNIARVENGSHQRPTSWVAHRRTFRT